MTSKTKASKQKEQRKSGIISAKTPGPKSAPAEHVTTWDDDTVLLPLHAYGTRVGLVALLGFFVICGRHLDGD